MVVLAPSLAAYGHAMALSRQGPAGNGRASRAWKGAFRGQPFPVRLAIFIVRE